MLLEFFIEKCCEKDGPRFAEDHLRSLFRTIGGSESSDSVVDATDLGLFGKRQPHRMGYVV
jgi:hypothetical protein